MKFANEYLINYLIADGFEQMIMACYSLETPDNIYKSLRLLSFTLTK